MVANKGIVNDKLRKVLNKVFPFKKSKSEKSSYGITTVDEDITLGLIALNGAPLKQWNNPQLHINDIKLDFKEGKRVTIKLDLLKKAIALLETQGETATLLIDDKLPIVLKTEDYAVVIAQYADNKETSAKDEWEKVKQVLDTIRITEAL